MKISALIIELEQIRSMHGDLPVKHEQGDDWPDVLGVEYKGPQGLYVTQQAVIF